MEENIEVKDVQKTEYLDKNGLDMLWAKVKENTNNQVEVEYNRAKAKEDSLSQEIASVKPDEGKSYIQAKLTSKEQDGDSCSYDVAGDISFKSEYSDSYSGPITKINKNGIDINFDNEPTFGNTGSLKAKLDSNYNITMQGNGRLMHDTRDTFNEVSMQLLDNVDTTYANSSNGNSMLISQLGIFYTSQSYALTSNDLLTGHGSYKTIGTDIAPLENGKVPEEYLDLSQYAKKTDIPEIDTSDFVSKTGPEDQVINSILGVTGGGIQVFDGAVDDSNEGVALMPTTLEFGYANNRSAILLRGSEVDGQNGSKIIIKTELENPYIKLSDGTDDDHTGGDTLTITNEGISNTDNNADHVYATDGSIADLTQYAKKSEISAGGNVDDVRVNGVSVVENKIANIKPATKENLGVVKVGDGLNVTDGTISVDSTAIGSGNYVTYKSIYQGDCYEMSKGLIYQYDNGFDRGNLYLGPTKIETNANGGTTSVQGAFARLTNGDDLMIINAYNIDCRFKSVRYLEITKNGVWLKDGDDNHVLTSNASTIDITQYVLKSVYDEKIAALEARIAALEAKHAEAA